MKILNMEEDLKRAVETLKEGGIILYPTDTIWGLGCDATDDRAVKRLFDIKRRPDAKAMISLVSSLEMLKEYVGIVPEEAKEEIAAAQRPVTVIYDHPRLISSLLVANDGSAAFRIPRLEFARELCGRLGHPVVSTSANISGQKAPAVFDEILSEIKDKADYICEFGRKAVPSSPSRIVKITDCGVTTVIRE